jgi:glutamine synthetase
MGSMKNISIPIEQMGKALDNEIMFDGSSIDGFARIEESDMFLRPDIRTFQVFPWRPKQGVEARLICDVYTSEGKPFSGCPRNILIKAIGEAAEYGYTLNVGAECEFYLFKLDEKGAPTLSTNDDGVTSTWRRSIRGKTRAATWS